MSAAVVGWFSLGTDFFYLELAGVPFYHIAIEVFLVLWIVWLLLRKSPKLEEIPLSRAEEDQIIAEWQPEPLVPKVTQRRWSEENNNIIVEGKPGREIIVCGQKCLNAGSYNFLNFADNPDLEDAACKTIAKYGVGSCGPRGFYGTVDVHLNFEEAVAKFFNCEECCLYSFGFSTISSVIPSYSKRGDVMFVDEGVSFPIQKGVEASRSTVYWFRHNDMGHLEDLMKDQAVRDAADSKKARATRRFLIVEGLYVNYGDLCPLPKLLALKWKYKVRLFVEESYSFGTIGATGRGVTEHFNVDRNEVDLIVGSLETSLASTGGFVVGSTFYVDHQRLSGLGYCFSASLPPALAVTATEALAFIDKDSSLPQTLQLKSAELHTALTSLLKELLVVEGAVCSPLKHLYIREEYRKDNRDENEEMLETIQKRCREAGVAVVAAHYLLTEHLLPEPSIRLTINVSFSSTELKRIASVLKVSSEAVLRNS